jgi:hypothetical protein
MLEARGPRTRRLARGQATGRRTTDRQGRVAGVRVARSTAPGRSRPQKQCHGYRGARWWILQSHARGDRVREFWAFLRARKKWWLAPLLLFLLAFGAVLIVSQTSAL